MYRKKTDRQAGKHTHLTQTICDTNAQNHKSYFKQCRQVWQRGGHAAGGEDVNQMEAQKVEEDGNIYNTKLRLQLYIIGAVD